MIQMIAFFILPLLSFSISTDVLIIICVSVPLGVMVIITFIVFICIKLANCRKEKENNMENNMFSETTASLIPPVFFTEGISDPLKQEDLIDGH